MATPLYSIPGAAAREPAAETTPPATAASTVHEVLAQSQVEAVLDELERDLVGLVPVKQRIRDIAALLVIDKLRAGHGLVAQIALAAHELHRQPRHRQDHGGHAHGRDPASPGLRAQRPPGGGDAR